MQTTISHYPHLMSFGNWSIAGSSEPSTTFQKRSENRVPVKDTVLVSHVFDSYAKHNVALALSNDRVIVVNQSNTCISCCIDKIQKSDARHGYLLLCKIEGDMYESQSSEIPYDP